MQILKSIDKPNPGQESTAKIIFLKDLVEPNRPEVSTNNFAVTDLVHTLLPNESEVAQASPITKKPGTIR